jgi:sugar lactone lactonase YvrE
MSDQILYFSPEGEFLGQVGNDALSGATPSSLAMDADGYFYVGTWNQGIVKIDPNGNIMGTWGSNTDEDTERAEGVFKYPDAITVDADGNVYVVDWGGEYSYMTKFIFP